jgi:hypothetical protein
MLLGYDCLVFTLSWSKFSAIHDAHAVLPSFPAMTLRL